MPDDIIDLTRYRQEVSAAELPRGSMTLWGAEGERARFALPLWRVIHLARAERGMLVRHPVNRPGDAEALVVLDMGADPARTDVDGSRFPRFTPQDGPCLVDLESDGLLVFLGARSEWIWLLVVDGGERRSAPLQPAAREDVLFLAGECAGLLLWRDLDEDGSRGQS